MQMQQMDYLNASPSPAQPGQASPSDSIEGSLVCQFCSKVLQGKMIYLQSNMRRHIRELHTKAARSLTCTIDGCSKTFTRRHNLQQHQSSIHRTGRATYNNRS